MSEPMTFDEILADKTYQSEFDKRVTKALDTAKTKWDTELGGEKIKTLKLFGIESEDELPALTEEFNEFKAKKAKAEEDKPEIERLKGELKAKTKLETNYTKALEELKSLRQESALKAHGVTDSEDLEIFSIRINKLVTDDKDFQTAAAEYFTEHPIKKPEPPPVPKFGGAPDKKTTKSTSVDMNKLLFGGKK